MFFRVTFYFMDSRYCKSAHCDSFSSLVFSSRFQPDREDQLVPAIHCLVDGPDLVRKYVPQLRTGVKFPSFVRTDSHDHICRLVQHFVVDQSVLWLMANTYPEIFMIVLISILSNTVAQIGAVRMLSFIL